MLRLLVTINRIKTISNKAGHYYRYTTGNSPSSWRLEPLARKDLPPSQDQRENIREIHRVFPGKYSAKYCCYQSRCHNNNNNSNYHV